MAFGITGLVAAKICSISSRIVLPLSIQSTCLRKMSAEGHRIKPGKWHGYVSSWSELPEVRVQSEPTWLQSYASAGRGKLSCRWRGFRGDRESCATPPTL